MELDDIKISKAIVDSYFNKLLKALELDVALVGGGPANLVCGAVLGRNGIKAAVFESKLAPGGGMWGGGMMFNEIVVQESALALLDEFGIRYSEYEKGYYTANSVEAAATLIAQCVKSGTELFNLIKVVDVMFRGEEQKRINGLVLQWTAVEHINLHVDPLTVRARFVVDGTGHPAEVCSIVSRKLGARLNTQTGKVVGEMSMWASRGEELTIKNSCEVYPGLYIAGMAANAVKGAPRMGPVFGGMLLSGKKIAEELIGLIKK
ncbi:MAG: thiazole biosynthesis protein [Spirochaetales bacterium]|nr:thiazole biosynthesis protein [Spirochaetales bacterium]